MRQVVSLITTTSRVSSRLVAYFCVGLIYLILGLLVTQVLMRYFLGAPPSWTEELAIILFAWLVLLYATVGLYEGFHVAIESIPARFERLHRCAGITPASMKSHRSPRRAVKRSGLRSTRPNGPCAAP